MSRDRTETPGIVRFVSTRTCWNTRDRCRLGSCTSPTTSDKLPSGAVDGQIAQRGAVRHLCRGSTSYRPSAEQGSVCGTVAPAGPAMWREGDARHRLLQTPKYCALAAASGMDHFKGAPGSP